SRDAMAILEGDEWPGNVRELEAVVKRAMVHRGRGWVTPADIALPRLRRDRIPESVRALEIRLTSAQEQALRLAATRCEVRRRGLVEGCGISPSAARRALLGLERVGAVRRAGSGRGARYVPAPAAGGVGGAPASRRVTADRGSPGAALGP